MRRTFTNISERKHIGYLLKLLKPVERMGTIAWTTVNRVLTQEESYYSGAFDCDKIPALEYVYICCDNRYIYIITAMKGSQIGWSELTNNVIGRTISVTPQKMQWAFPSLEPAKVYSREKLKPFFKGTKALRDLINVNVVKESFSYFAFPCGFLKLTTLGAISSAKTSSIQFIGCEEPDDFLDNVKNQGNILENLKGRQKSFPIGAKKLLIGGTPTDKDFSRVEMCYKESNKMVFKAECHHCKGLSELSTKNLHYNMYKDRYIDEVYGKYDPTTAHYLCPLCLGEWSEEEKNQNIEAGKKHGFIDFKGNHSKGWHAEKPEITENFGFHIPELLSTISSSTFVHLAENMIKADLALEKGDEGLSKSKTNNTDGLPYASGITSMEAEDMVKLRLNYPEGIVPMEGLVLSAGVDVQHNRLAYVVRAWGRSGSSWLVKWEELYGDCRNREDPVWQELSNKVVRDPYPHASGKELYVTAISIDSSDNSDLVYDWVLDQQEINPHVFATKGTRDLKFSDDEIYREPSRMGSTTYSSARKTLAETKGVLVYNLGAHRCQEEILRRISLNATENAVSNVYYFNEQSYGSYEEQMTACRKIIDPYSTYTKSVFKLIPGRHKEAMDAEKNALHANYAAGIRNYTDGQFAAIEKYLFNL